MSALPRIVLDGSPDIDDLLDSFIADRGCRPAQARILRRAEELPWLFRGYVRARKAGRAWRAWTAGFRTSFLIAEVAEPESIERGVPELEVCFFDAEGQPFPRSLWRRRTDGSWLEHIRP